ncbi:MAG: hypothetical protein LUG24_07890 [Clostridiales bacterium]|nr:hypothetical protein [Clostridiales bacterium]
MKEENFVGFIFTGCEILYLAKCMGAESIIGMQLSEFKNKGEVMEEAEKKSYKKKLCF